MVTRLPWKRKTLIRLVTGPRDEREDLSGIRHQWYTFYTKKKDQSSKHQNSGVTMVSYADDETIINERFFGRTEEIWELNYCGEKMPMFRVRWATNVEKEGRYFTTMVIPEAKSSAKVQAKNEPWVLVSQVDQCFFITDPVRRSRVVVVRGKRSIIRMEGAATEQDFDKYGDPKIKEEFDKYFDRPSDAARRRKTTLPAKGCPYTRRNPYVSGLNYSTAKKKGKKIVTSR
jgi:hypothetical protein